MTKVNKFIKRCRVTVEVDWEGEEKKAGNFHSNYFIDKIEQGFTLKDFFIDAQSSFDED